MKQIRTSKAVGLPRFIYGLIVCHSSSALSTRAQR